MRRGRWIFMAAAVVMAACATQDGVVKDGTRYGVTDGTFRGRWWSYYERGASYLEGGHYDKAAADFQQALKGRSEDAWSARTYGLHFVPYFPNRDLGVAYYHLGRLDEAEKLLNRSIEDVDSERARRYLDLITKARIETGALMDADAPQVFAASESGALSRSREVTLRAEASDATGVERLAVAREAVPLRGSSEALVVEKTMVLAEGDHEIPVEATDLAGKTQATATRVSVDLTGPMIFYFEPGPQTVVDAAAAPIRGMATDVHGVAFVRVREASTKAEIAAVAKAVEAGIEFRAEVSLTPGENAFVVEAVDNAGNVTASAVSMYRGVPGSVEASLWKLRDRGVPLRFAADNLDPAMILAAAEDPAPVRINVKFPRPATDTGAYRKREIRLAGRVEAEAGLSNFVIQGESYPTAPAAKQIEFSKRIPVSEGAKTEITVAAADTAGQREQWQTEIVGQPVLLDEYRMKVAVQHVEGATDDQARFLLGMLTAKLAEVDRQRFQVVERTQLEAVLQELELASSDLADPRFAARLGQVKPADVFLFGEAFPREDGGLELLFRAIDATSSTVLANHDVYIADWTDRETREERLDAVAQWLAREFPRVPGAVLRTAGRNVWVDLGKEDGVREGMKAVVAYEAFPPVIDETTGETLEEGFYDAAAWAPLAGVSDTRSKLGDLNPTVEENDEPTIEEGQPVFTM